MRKKGRVVYVPPNVFEELNCIKADEKLNSNADAFREMVKFSRVGREAKRIFTLRF